MMRLTQNNINFVKRYTKNGVTYQYFVGMKDRNISSTRVYINYDENGKTVVKHFDKEWLPKSVQKFIDSHEETLMNIDDQDEFLIYMIG